MLMYNTNQVSKKKIEVNYYNNNYNNIRKK